MTTLSPNAEGLSSDTLMGLLKTMLLIRRFEEKIVEVYGKQDMRTPVHLCIGQEAIPAGVCANLRRDDYMFTTHRGHGHCLAKGAAPEKLFAEFYGRQDGCCRGRGGSMHPADPDCGILGASAIVGGAIPLGAGAALAAKLQKTDRISVVFFGDGASEEGVFAESMMFAALKKLPVLFVCENNLYATNSPIDARQPHRNIAARAKAHGVPAQRLNGNDVVAVFEAARQAVAQLRGGQGPAFLECLTYRWYGHVGPEFDHLKGCRPEQELKDWQRRCPLRSFVRKLTRRKLLTKADLKAMTATIDESLATAVETARRSPLPSPSELLEHVYYKGT